MLSQSQTVVLTVAVVLPAVATLFVGLRLFTRLYITRNIKLDDYMLIIALVQFVSVGYLPIVLNPPKSITVIYKVAPRWVTIVATISYSVSIGAVKFSILLQYLRFLSDKRSKYMCWIMMVVTFLWVIAGLVGSLAIRKSAEEQPSSMKTGDLPKTVTWALTIINIVTDFLILTIPVPSILRLENISMKRKLSILGLFATGTSVGIFAVLRSVYILAASVNLDKLWLTGVWTNAELCSAVICASLPGIKPLFKFRARRSNVDPPVQKESRNFSHCTGFSIMSEANWERAFGAASCIVPQTYTVSIVADSSKPGPINDSNNV